MPSYELENFLFIKDDRPLSRFVTHIDPPQSNTGWEICRNNNDNYSIKFQKGTLLQI